MEDAALHCKGLRFDISEGRQHKHLVKRQASAANYPLVPSSSVSAKPPVALECPLHRNRRNKAVLLARVPYDPCVDHCSTIRDTTAARHTRVNINMHSPHSAVLLELLEAFRASAPQSQASSMKPKTPTCQCDRMLRIEQRVEQSRVSRSHEGDVRFTKTSHSVCLCHVPTAMHRWSPRLPAPSVTPRQSIGIRTTMQSLASKHSAHATV